MQKSGMLIVIVNVGDEMCGISEICFKAEVFVKAKALPATGSEWPAVLSLCLKIF